MRLVFFLGTLCAAVLAKAQMLEFSGYITTSAQTKFVLTNLDSKKSSRWLKHGDSFEGYTISAFDPGAGVLSVSKADQVLRLYLKHAKVEDREATLAAILKEHETRYLLGQIDHESVFLSRAALLSFRRESASSLEEKITFQKLLVSECEKRESVMRHAHSVGVAADLDVLERTEDLLRERVRLRAMESNVKEQ